MRISLSDEEAKAIIADYVRREVAPQGAKVSDPTNYIGRIEVEVEVEISAEATP